jgi:hypothetical protein
MNLRRVCVVVLCAILIIVGAKLTIGSRLTWPEFVKVISKNQLRL